MFLLFLSINLSFFDTNFASVFDTFNFSATDVGTSFWRSNSMWLIDWLHFQFDQFYQILAIIFKEVFCKLHLPS